MGKFPINAASCLALVLSLLLLVACSEETNTERERTREFVEGTLSSPEPPETTVAATTTGGTTGGVTRASGPDILLRLEGDPKTTFSGICTTGAEERNVIGGKVPKIYRFDLNGQNLSCRIQKRNPGRGSLRVTLLSGDDTRSAQETESTNSIIRLSYTGE